MKVRSEYRKEFILDETDVVMWNGRIYQLMTQKEYDSTYPVLIENQVRMLINSGQLIKTDEYISDFTKVPVTLYKKVS